MSMEVDHTHVDSAQALAAVDPSDAPDLDVPPRFSEPVMVVGAASYLALVPGLIALGVEPLAAVGVVCVLAALDLVKRALVRPNQ